MSIKEIPNRIRIRSTQDIRHYLKSYPFKGLTDFFMEYESRNRLLPKTEVYKRMQSTLIVMKESIAKGKAKVNRTPSGLINGGCHTFLNNMPNTIHLMGEWFNTVIANTLAVSELNACMGRIVATPTAGACGVMPGAFLTICDKFSIPEDKQIQSLFIAGGMGELIQINASLSGSQHGCQAEVGSASAITASAIVALFEVSLDKIENAAALAMSNLLGLVCDPVAGLVEFPCVHRNIVGSVNAIACAQMALAGLTSPIPFDEVVSAMKQIGDDLPASLKETSRGGLAITPTGLRIQRKVRDEDPEKAY
ncbi:MAG: L-serine ammonia-lyase, iron-sulfur-dependent, subunit alpha [Caldisericia bacterium]|nr:L-serine ammonia-lyase, iron-sulfur-dependent, subunit alpha [Caldisericia bacterium]MDD4614585.1 L-serine ammonia-lyase, iron-sulfur-dependent, subunit alpha [Caldisericia bacterium]